MRKIMFVLAATLIALCAEFGPLGFDRCSLAGEAPVLFEIVLRTELVSSTPIYEPGHENDASRIIGFSTVSNAYLINAPMESGILPPTEQDLGAPIGTTTAQLYFSAGVYADKSQEAQIAAVTGMFAMSGATMSFEGSSMIRWVQNPSDPALEPGDVRWTDFSMGITETTGNLAGWKGQVIGSRLLIGNSQDPVTFQSGFMIFRLIQ